MDSKLIKNQLIQSIEIEDLTSDGDGIAKYDGMVVFVAGAIPGDVARIRITKVLKNYAYARTEQVIVPSPDRIEKDCNSFPKCGGCDLRHMSYRAELKFKEKTVNDAMERIAGINFKCEKIFGAENICNYRNKSIIPIVRQNNRVIGGFFRNHSHDVVEINGCKIQKDVAEKALKAVLEYIKQTGVSVYNEQTGKGLIRRLFVRCSKDGKSAIVCLISSGSRIPEKDLLVRLLLDYCPEVEGIILNINRTNGNTVLGDKYTLLWGNDYITDSLLGVEFKISVPSFFQINPQQAEVLYSEAINLAQIDKNSVVIDLYCGAGTITMCIAKYAKHVYGIEIVPEAIEDAKHNAEMNNIDNVEFFCGDAGEYAQKLNDDGIVPDVITVDPPRHGLDDKTVDAIKKFMPKRIVYVSCNPATMARDVKKLAETGFAVNHLEAVDMFPRTKHVECVVLLTKTHM